jgi:hypothetical protein
MGKMMDGKMEGWKEDGCPPKPPKTPKPQMRIK